MRFTTKAVQIKEDDDLLNFLICTPYGINIRRFLMNGWRTEQSETTILTKEVPVEPEKRNSKS